MSRATRARSSATARPNSAWPIARQTPTSEHAVCDHAQEVALEHEVARHDRCQHEVEVGERGKRRGEAQPAVEITPGAPEAKRKADEGDEPERGQHEERRPARGRPLARPTRSARGARRPRARRPGARARPQRQHRGGRRAVSWCVLRRTAPTAISAAPRRRAPTSRHASGGASDPPPSTGTSPNATVPTAMLKKPAARSRSSFRPSTRNLMLVSTQTNVATTATTVSNASLASCRW